MRVIEKRVGTLSLRSSKDEYSCAEDDRSGVFAKQPLSLMPGAVFSIAVLEAGVLVVAEVEGGKSKPPIDEGGSEDENCAAKSGSLLCQLPPL